MATLEELQDAIRGLAKKQDGINSRLDRMNGALEERCQAHRDFTEQEIKRVEGEHQNLADRVKNLDYRFWAVLMLVLGALARLFVGGS